MECLQSITVDGKVIEFKGIEELNDYILKNKDFLTVLGVLPQVAAVYADEKITTEGTLRNLKKETIKMREEGLNLTNTLLDYYKGKTQKDSQTLMIPSFNDPEYEKVFKESTKNAFKTTQNDSSLRTIKNWTSLSDAEKDLRAEEYANKQWANAKNENDLAGKAGKELHGFIKKVLNKTMDENQKYSVPDANLMQVIENLSLSSSVQISDDSKMKLLEYVRKLRDNYKNFFSISDLIIGDELTILPNGIKDVIDFIYVSETPQGKMYHIVDISLSARDISNWDDAKKLSMQYKLMGLKQLLISKGVDPELINIEILPVKVSYNSDASKVILDEMSIENVTSALFANLGTDRFQDNVDNLIPVNSFIKADIIEDKNEEMYNYISTVFGNGYRPKYDYHAFSSWIINTLGRKSSTGKYYFIDKYNKKGNNVYELDFLESKNYTVDELAEEIEKQNSPLKNIIDTFIEKRDSELGNTTFALIGTIQTLQRTDKSGEDFLHLYNSAANKKVDNIINTYIKSGYTAVRIPQLEKLGIITLELNGILEFITLTNRVIDHQYHLHDGKDKDAYTSIFSGPELDLSDDEVRVKGINSAMRSTGGNNEIIKTLLALNSYSDIFAKFNKKFNNITVINVNDGRSVNTKINRGYVLDQFSRLTNTLGIENKFGISNIKINDSLDSTLYELSGLMKNYADNRKITSIFEKVSKKNEENKLGDVKTSKDLIDIVTNDKWDAYLKYKYIEELEHELLSRFPELVDRKGTDIESPQFQMYHIISTLKIEFKNIALMSEYDINKIGVMLNGSLITNPDHVPSSIARQVTRMIYGSQDRILDEMDPIRVKSNNLTRSYYQSQGYSNWKSLTFGFTNKYNNIFFQKDATGKYLKEFLFVNPYSENNLDNNQKSYLKEMLWTLNSYRNEDLKEYRGLTEQEMRDKHGSRLDEIIYNQDKNYFEAPLVQTSLSEKFQNNKVANLFSYMKRNFIEDFSNFKDQLNVNEPVRKFIEEQNDSIIVSRYNIPPEVRFETLEKYTPENFETNLETIVLSSILEQLKVEEMGKTNSVINNILFEIEFQTQMSGMTNQNIIDYIDKIRKILVQWKTIDTPEEKHFRSVTSTLKSMATMSALGLHLGGFIKELSNGQWEIISRSLTNFYGKETFGLGDYAKALKFVALDNKDQMWADLSLIEALNFKYRIYDMSLSKIVEKLKTDKTGLARFSSRYMLWFAGAGDYINRLTMFSAQMIHDGTLRAHSLDEAGNLIYDFNKDERFNVYRAGLKSDPEYSKQRALYRVMIDKFNEEGFTKRNADGNRVPLDYNDPLPQAFTYQEKESLKSFSDSTFGYLDTDRKAMASHHAVWSIWMQFKTFWSGKLKLWLEHPDSQLSTQGAFKQRVDPKTGKPVFIKYVDAEGNDVTSMSNEEISKKLQNKEIEPKETLEDNGNEYFEWTGSPSEGFLWSLWYTGKSIAQGDFKKKVYNNQARLANLKLMGLDMLAYGFLLFFIALLFEGEENNPNPDNEAFLSTIQGYGKDTLWLSLKQMRENVTMGSLFEFTFTPPLYSIGEQQANNIFDLATGDKSFAQALRTAAPFARIFIPRQQ